MNNASNNASLLGKTIRVARINKGLKQYELAEQINVTANYVSLIESGKKIPSLRIVNNIASRLDVKVSALLMDDSVLKDLIEITQKYDLDALIEGLQKIKSQT